MDEWMDGLMNGWTGDRKMAGLMNNSKCYNNVDCYHIQAPSFYWEVELIQLDSGSTAPHLTLGFCPDPIKPGEGEVWTYPEETCLFRR